MKGSLVTQSHQLHEALIGGQFHINADLVIPKFSTPANFNLWAKVLIGENSWGSAKYLPELPKALEDREQLFIASFLCLSQMLFELGRMPIFDQPVVRSLGFSKQSQGRYAISLELPIVQFISPLAYQIPIKAALAICNWMAQNIPTTENKRKVFNTIEQQVLQPLYQHVPAGKSTIPILKVAHALGIPFFHLGLGVYQLGWGSKARRIDRTMIELDSVIGSRLAQHKVVTANLLRLAGLPAPTHAIALTEQEAIGAAAQIGFPVVIKPTDRDRGEGVTVNITDNLAVKIAFSAAQKLAISKQVIVEREVPGVCHRLFIVNGQLLYAVKRLPISITGDGVLTIDQLVNDQLAHQMQKPPWVRSRIRPIDELAVKVLAQLGLTPQSIPAIGMVIPLRPIESSEWGGIHEDVTHSVHPDNLSAAIAATRLFGLQVAGIDIITSDITKPWFENGAIINEVNFAPLLGRTEITRSYIPKFLSLLIDKKGTIPIEFFELKREGLQRQAELTKQGLRCFFTSYETTMDWSGNVIAMPLFNIKERVKALICRSDVDAIIVQN